jgi:hypothetical protein
MTTKTKWGFVGAGSIVMGLFWGCGGSLGSEMGGESHFLIHCDDSCDAGLSCIASVCTRGCVIDEDSCTDLHPEAECTDASIEPGQVAVCDVACTDDADCDGLGANFSCESGQCRGDAAAASGTGGSSNSSSATSGGGGAGATCEHLLAEYPDGATFDNHAGCGTCTCDEGEVQCTISECDAPVFPCPADVHTDPIDVTTAFVEGDALLLDVTHAGGCEMHDYGVCYEAGVSQSTDFDTYIGELHVIHDSNGDSCEAIQTATLRFDLGPYAEYIMTELDVPGGVVSTSRVVYPFGELTCDERFFAAWGKPAKEATQLNYDCTEDADCVWAPVQLSCYAGCPTPMTVAHQDRFATAMQDVEATVCGEGAELCEFAEPACEAPDLACIDGTCRPLEN